MTGVQTCALPIYIVAGLALPPCRHPLGAHRQDRGYAQHWVLLVEGLGYNKKEIDKTLEKIDPAAHASRATATPKNTAVQTVSGLIGGGIKALPLGAVVAAVGAGTSHVIKAKSGKSMLTITTDMNIHALTNEGQNSMGITVVLRDQVPIGRALERAALTALGLPLPQERAQIEARVSPESHPDAPGSPIQQQVSIHCS